MDTHSANGARFIAADDMIVRWCRKHRAPFEPETTDWMFAVMAERGGGLFADVGASTGWFSIPMAMRGYDVVACEPNPAVACRLWQNARLNNARLRVVEKAVSDRCAPATFWHNPAVPLTSGGSIERPTCAKPERITVPTVTLDGTLGGDASLIKVDVEGHEGAVLAGAAGIISRCRPHLVLEANTEADREKLGGWLAEHGYEWRRADGRNLLCSPRS